MDKAEPKNQIVCWHEQECSHDSNMDSNVRIPANCIFEVSVWTRKKYAAVIATIAAQFV